MPNVYNLQRKDRNNPLSPNYKRPLLQSEIERAQEDTLSGQQAARYLNVHYQTYKKYAKRYGIFEKHKSTGANIPKAKIGGNYFSLINILAGKHPNYNTNRLKQRLLKSGLMAEECMLCGYTEKRVQDYKAPLMLVYKDGNSRNHLKENLELLCYNCAFLTAGNLNNVHNRKISQSIKEEPIDREPLIAKEDSEWLSEDEITKLQDEVRDEVEDKDMY